MALITMAQSRNQGQYPGSCEEGTLPKRICVNIPQKNMFSVKKGIFSKRSEGQCLIIR